MGSFVVAMGAVEAAVPVNRDRAAKSKANVCLRGSASQTAKGRIAVVMAAAVFVARVSPALAVALRDCVWIAVSRNVGRKCVEVTVAAAPVGSAKELNPAKPSVFSVLT
jgi:hypothetical protein